MSRSAFFERYMSFLLEGNRRGCFEAFEEHRRECRKPMELFTGLLWPAMTQVERLYRADRINKVTEQMATRVNRQLADQVRRFLEPQELNGKAIVITCADGEPEELGAQMLADLFESAGWRVYFVGGGVPNDEIISLVGHVKATILLIYGTTPQGVPGVRQLIDTLREIGVCPTMNVLVSGGVFNRADGLWEEVNADLSAPDAQSALEIAEQAEPREPKPTIPGAPKKRRRRRKPPFLAVGANA
jgi:methanogenic corrinoid protein MtbC1